MKKLTILGTTLIPLFFSCSTTKKTKCDAYGYIHRDTIILTTEHIHIGTMCSPDTTMVLCVADTFRIPFKPKQR
jgi:hypothetical protein